MAVERLNYFTGLFLNASDFQLEQDYHLLMRRRLNFGLFQPGVLFGLDVDRLPPDSVRVNPGMAIDRHEAESQGREIVLTGAHTIDLRTFTNGDFANGDQVYIVISYNQAITPREPPFNTGSRITEEPIIKPFHVRDLPEDRNRQIILAKVTVGNLSAPDLSERQLAQLRLGGGANPTITSLSFSKAPRQGSNVQMTINGANLAEGRPQLTILDTSNESDAAITATIEGASSNTKLIFNLVIAPTADLGDRRVRVQTDRGTVTTDPEGATAFEVFPPEPEIDNIDPKRGRQTVDVPVTIRGRNLAANPEVTVWLNETTRDPNVTVDRGAVTPDSITAILKISREAAAGGRIVRIQTAGGGEATSPADFFTVQPLPDIKSYSPIVGAPATPITINGSDIRSEPPGQPTATVVRFVDPSNSQNVGLGGAPIVLSDVPTNIGPQRIEVRAPAQGTLPPVVQLILEIDRVTVTAREVFTFL